MDLVKVDVVGLEAAQGRLALFDDVAAVVALGVGVVVVHRAVHFGRQDDAAALPVALKRLAHGLLAAPAAVDVGRIQEVDPSLDGAVDDVEGFWFGGLAPKHHAAQALHADLHPRPPEIAVFHVELLWI